jgi:RNA polymerase sigma-70 factor, ECF subfamily
MQDSSPPSQRQGAYASPAQEFEMLYVESFRGVYGYIAARVQDVQTAEDLTSETFLRAWRSWPPRTTVGLVPQAWLFTIARNLVIDHYRAAGRRPVVALDEAGVPSPGRSPGEDGHLERLALRTALGTLSPHDQDVLSLRLAGVSNRDMGSILNLSEAAAGMAYLRALRRLQERLGEL